MLLRAPAFDPATHARETCAGHRPMARFRLRAVVAAAVAALALHGGMAWAESAPLKISYGATFGAPIPDPSDPNIASLVDDMFGTATMLGRYTGSYPHLVNFAAGTFSGTATFRAANGDLLLVELGGTGTPTGPTTFAVVFHGTITGGSGRFAGASGYVDGPGSVDLAGGVVTGYLEGTLVAPALN